MGQDRVGSAAARRTWSWCTIALGVLLVPVAALAQGYQLFFATPPPGTGSQTASSLCQLPAGVQFCDEVGQQPAQNFVRPSVDTSAFPECKRITQPSMCAGFVKCTDQFGNPVKGCQVQLSAQYRVITGGHLHPDAINTKQPFDNGSFSPSSGVTDGNGIFCTVYTAPQAAGLVDVIVAGGTGSTIGVEIKDLTDLPLPGTGARYAIAPSTGHDSNNRGVRLDVTEHLRVDVPAKFAKVLTTKNISTPPVITYTSLSLPFGGLFDVDTDNRGLIDNQWNPPHCGHRNGDAVDIGLDPAKFPRERRPELRAAVCGAGFDFPYLKESPAKASNHWHARWRPSGKKERCPLA